MDFKYRDILLNDAQLGPYPLEKLKRVDAPTTQYVSEHKSKSVSESGMDRAIASDAGKVIRETGIFFNNRDPLCSAYSSFENHIAQFNTAPVADIKAPIPDDPRILSRHIKSLAYFTGADMVGICKLPESALYTEALDEFGTDAFYKYAIVLLNVKKTNVIRQSYGREWIDDPCSFQVYQQCACQGQIITDYLKRLGWRSYASVFDNYSTLMPQLVVESGLGEGSRLGIALNPFVGSCFKVSAVLTDLPLDVDKPIDFGLQDYCASCKICAEQCPTQAIPAGEKVEYNGFVKWKTEAERCAKGVIGNTVGNMCQRCAKVCPWNRRDNAPADFANWDGSISALHESVNRQAKLLKENMYAEPEEFTEKWWFPLHRDPDNLDLVVEGDEFNYNFLMSKLKRQGAPELNATTLCDSESEDIKALMAKLTADLSNNNEIAKAIFDYVRDQVLFEYDEYIVKASETLAKEHGLCWNKALLMTALLRAANIPTKMAYSILNREFLRPQKGDDCLLFDETVRHYFNLVWLKGKWISVDATIDIGCYEKFFVPAGVHWEIDWNGKDNMVLYTEHIIEPMIIVEDIDGTYGTL